MKHKFFLVLLAFLTAPAYSADLRGRMGVGATNQLGNQLPALSLKVQHSRATALGAVVGFNANQERTLYGAGVKLYRIIYDEPQLNFYLAGMLALQNFQDRNETVNGYQADGTLGTEFHFSGLESIGFSFEFGFSARKAAPGGTSFQTVGDQMLTAAVHFYL
jgi:hypothetical protein